MLVKMGILSDLNKHEKIPVIIKCNQHNIFCISIHNKEQGCGFESGSAFNFLPWSMTENLKKKGKKEIVNNCNFIKIIKKIPLKWEQMGLS